MLFFIGQLLPYIAVAVFLTGTCCRVAVWLRSPVPFELTLFPAAKSRSGRVLAIGKELLLFDSLRCGDKWLWLWAWLLHVSLAFIIIGHIVGIYYLTKQFTLIGLSSEASSSLSALLGIVSGIVFFAAIIVLFYRRTVIPEVKRLSDPADYFDLLLLLAIVVTGMHMRLTSHVVDLPAVRAYIGGLLTLHPTPIPQDEIFISHFTLVNILLIYFPFSKLIHLAGFIVNRMIVAQPAPVYPTPAGVKCGVSFREGDRQA
jgi:nitrate reductase gamma subunit